MDDYRLLLIEIKKKIQQAQVKTVIAANTHMLFVYWEMGNFIIRHQQEEGWGAKIISLSAADLKKEYPSIKGFSARNLLYMKQFSEAYPIQLLQQFIQFESRLSVPDKLTQYSADIFLLFDNQCIEIAQQPAAQLIETIFYNL